MSEFINRFRTFDKLIATSLIKLLYWIGIVVIALSVLAGVLGGFSQGFTSGIASLVLAPLAGAIGVIFWRFLCEIYIVIFGMYDRLGEIQKSLAKD
ncbi:MAG: DUF4282 domain-containing protein [Alphaproteobacteria bacterium]|nr:DUF4282 domain-containing protein [Alphaproteobacteria bacterium]